MASPFVWHELLTSDPEAATAFYSSVFGWTATAGGLASSGRASAGVRASKLHPHWAPFVRVPDPEASAEAALRAGGRIAGRPSSPAGIVLVDPRDVPTVVTSAEGNDPFVWHILESTDVEASKAWMAAIAGFSSPEGSGLWRGDEQIASLVRAEHDRWLVHLLSADRLATRARALSLGASVEKADVDASGHGTFDVLVDPQGAAFCLFQAP
jgi:uncharacterized protein